MGDHEYPIDHSMRRDLPWLRPCYLPHIVSHDAKSSIPTPLFVSTLGLDMTYLRYGLDAS
jgi:hypothetical protein